MSWCEFCSLLSGLSEKSPLGRVVSIRLESDSEIIKSFTPAQHKIRNEWISKRRPVSCSKQQLSDFLKEIQAAFAAL